MGHAKSALVLVLIAAAYSCGSTGPIGEPAKFIRPTVAVESFENRAPFPLRGELGDGMADVLTAGLVKSGRFKVVSRAELGAVLDELALQHDPRFREQGRVTPGRLQNARYLVRGSVVDFTHTSGGGLHFMRGLVRGRAKGYVALVTITLAVIDIETREVLSSTFSGRAWAAEASLEATYRDISFGGKAFYRTPLGHATEEAIWKALQWLVEQVADSEWYPLIAKIEDRTVYLNGGHDRGLTVGEELQVREPGEAIIDPATGDILGHGRERELGRLRVLEVADRFAIAEILSGTELRVGLSCRRQPAPPDTSPSSDPQ